MCVEILPKHRCCGHMGEPLGHISCEHYKAIQELYKHYGPDIPNNDIRVITNTQNYELSSTTEYEWAEELCLECVAVAETTDDGSSTPRRP
jgi:hypothetical protein